MPLNSYESLLDKAISQSLTSDGPSLELCVEAAEAGFVVSALLADAHAQTTQDLKELFHGE